MLIFGSLTSIFGAIIIGYLLGSFPTGYLVGKLYGVPDISKVGYGHTGASNLLKSVGKVPFLVVLAIDTGKGIAGMAIAQKLFGLSDWSLLLPLTSLVIGHIWPIWLKPKEIRWVGLAFVWRHKVWRSPRLLPTPWGGRGLLVTVGACTWILPVGLPVALLLFVMIVRYTKRFVIATPIAFSAFPILAFFFGVSLPILVLLASGALGLWIMNGKGWWNAVRKLLLS